MAIVVPLLRRIDPYQGREILFAPINPGHLYQYIGSPKFRTGNIEHFVTYDSKVRSGLVLKKL